MHSPFGITRGSNPGPFDPKSDTLITTAPPTSREAHSRTMLKDISDDILILRHIICELWRRCIADGYCYQPACWYGEFSTTTGFCPCRKTLSYNSWRCRRDQLRVIGRRRRRRALQQSFRHYHQRQQQQQQRVPDSN